jgi:hypothetical protein
VLDIATRVGYECRGRSPLTRCESRIEHQFESAVKEAGVEVQIPGMQDIQKGSEVKVRKPGQGERGVWRVVGEVANSGPDDPAYDLTNLVSGRRRIFRASRLTLVRAARPGRR